MRYYAFNKPYGVLSQFTDEDGHPGLGRYLDLAKDVYPIGRLDHDSEGLLLLTNDNRLKNQLLLPKNEHPRTYLVQVEGAIAQSDIEKLLLPIGINFKGKTFLCSALKVSIVQNPIVEERKPPIRARLNIPTSWIKIELTQGKNRQVRRMTAHIGFPTLRLIRIAFGNIQLSDLKPGEWRELKSDEIKFMQQ